MNKIVIAALTMALSLAGASAWAKDKPEAAAAAGTTSSSTPSEVMKALKDDGDSADSKQKKLSAKQLAAIAQKQLEKLTQYAMDQIKPELIKKGTFEPVGAMVYRNGKINHLQIKSNKVPAVDKIRMFRVALRSLARHNKIDASVVIFSAQMKKNDKTKVIVENYEHRFGVSGTRIIAYRFENGKLKLAKPKDVSKPFFVFYDENKVQGTPRTEGKKL